MKYKNLDIKTVDVFFEIFSDPKKFIERMKEMRTARDEIRESLEVSDTKDTANNLLGKAENKMAEAQAYEDEMRADAQMAEAELVISIEGHEGTVLKDREWIATEKLKLSTDRGQFTRTSAALKKDLEEKLSAVARREDDVDAAEALLTERETAHAAYIKRVKAAV